MAFPTQRYNQAYNDYAFMDLCITGQINTLACLMEAEERYCFTRVDCIRFRRDLDKSAAAAVNRGRVDGALSSNNPDWRYKVARWLLRAADDLSIARQTAIIALLYCIALLLIRQSLLVVTAIKLLLLHVSLWRQRYSNLAKHQSVLLK